MSGRDVTSEVAELIDGYRPRMDPDSWEPIAGLVRDRVRAAAPRSAASARRMLSVVSRFVVWCRQMGIPDARMFGEAAIGEYIGSVDVGSGKGSRATVRSILRRVGRTPKGAETIGRHTPHPPYTSGELAALLQTAAHQRTGLLRRRSQAVICLSAGCGADPTDLQHITGSDIRRRTDGAVEVSFAGPRARTVVALGMFEDRLADLAVRFGTGRVLEDAHGHNVLPDLYRAFRGGPVPLNVGRLRNTWLVAMLAAPLPYRELLRAAGLTSPTTFTALLEHVPDAVGFDDWAFRHPGDGR